MPEETTGPSETPDVRTIRHLVRLMQRYDLTAIDLGEGPSKIRLRRRGAELAPAAAAPITPLPVAPPPQAATTAAATPAPAPAAAPKGTIIESPMVGTFYASNSPEAPPFVQVGSVIRADTTICIIEAMKVFTDIPAGIGGTIVEILVKSGQPVEYGQPLFRVSQD
jgi:acetyl-CoA carboxylase biotin carboxyl carrier protein